MKKLDSPKGDDPSEDYNSNDVENRLHRLPSHYARRSPSQQRSCGSRSPGSQSAIRKQQLRSQNLYNFAPLQENNAPGSLYTSPNVNFDEHQLPHYVVPVLYIPQRIITNEELYSSEIYDQDPVCDDFDQDGPPSTPKHSPSQGYPSFQKRLHRPTSTASRPHVSPYRHPHNHLTNSETNMYDKLMTKLYGMEQSEEEIAVENDFSDDYTASTDEQHQIPQDTSSGNSSTSLSSDYTRRQAPMRVKASSFTQNYPRTTSESPRYSPSTSAYTVYPMNQTEHVLHRPVKDQMIENFGNHREAPHYGKMRYGEPSAKSPEEYPAPIQMQNFFSPNLIFKEGVSESKCTQTTADTSTDTEPGDYSICTKSYDCMQKAEKGPARKKNKAKSLNCSNADVTVIIDRGSKEKMYTVLGSGSQYTTLQEQKFNKASECFATVDLLPVESSTLEPKNFMTIPKLRTHAVYSKSS